MNVHSLTKGRILRVLGDDMKIVDHLDEPDTGLSKITSRGREFTLPTALLHEIVNLRILVKCDDCEGMGEIHESPTYYNPDDLRSMECPSCNGSGIEDIALLRKRAAALGRMESWLKRAKTSRSIDFTFFRDDDDKEILSHTYDASVPGSPPVQSSSDIDTAINASLDEVKISGPPFPGPYAKA